MTNQSNTCAKLNAIAIDKACVAYKENYKKLTEECILKYAKRDFEWEKTRKIGFLAKWLCGDKRRVFTLKEYIKENRDPQRANMMWRDELYLYLKCGHNEYYKVDKLHKLALAKLNTQEFQSLLFVTADDFEPIAKYFKD